MKCKRLCGLESVADLKPAKIMMENGIERVKRTGNADPASGQAPGAGRWQKRLRADRAGCPGRFRQLRPSQHGAQGRLA